jgi:hypothetical protein
VLEQWKVRIERESRNRVQGNDVRIACVHISTAAGRKDNTRAGGVAFRVAGISISAVRYRRAMDEQQQPTIRITLDDNVAQGEYINFANIIHSPSEFVIDLGRIVPGRQDVKIYSRVIMTPLHAKQLLEALAQNIALFEQKFGEIRVDGASVFSSNEPSN